MGIMSKLGVIAGVVFIAAAATVVQFTGRSDARDPQTKSAPEVRAVSDVPSFAPRVLRDQPVVDKAVEARTFDAAARTAWTYVDKGYSPKTGFVVANPDWPYPTIWDIASGMAAFYAARGLGYITDEEYTKRTRRALETLSKVRMYHDIAYGRNYDANTGDLVGADQKPSEHGTGYSAIDLGRLLIWLKIVADSDPELAPLAEKVAQRLNAKALIKSGYLQGEEILKSGVSKYQEGRLGYEQYSATGFNLWSMPAPNALQMRSNVKRVKVNGIPLFADKRGLDRLTSEPFIMHGLEVGLTGEMREVAWQILALQAKRYAQTGQVTMASEDALKDPPHYFYYYCVYCSGKAFTINVHSPGVNLNAPRWVSSKAAFAWHAIMPSKYTWIAVEAVKRAEQPGVGWATGVYEKSGKSTEVLNLNTAAVILESALYYKTGKPFLKS